jgi:predicted MFS family arabinose efflux permease
MGMQGTISDIGHACGPLLAGLLIATFGYQHAFAIIAGLQVATAALFGATMRHI